MMLVEVTPVPETALPLAGFRAHLRLGTGFAEDGLQDAVLVGFLRAALAAVELRTGKALLEREFRLVGLDPATIDGQVLPVAPVTALVSAQDAQDAAVGLENLHLVLDAQRPCLRGHLPAIGEVSLTFMAGFGPEWSDLPADLAQAVMMLAAHYYEHRENVALEASCMPFGVTALIERYRNIRLFGGVRA